MELREVSGVIVGSAMKVHSALGPGLFESAYQVCMLLELRQHGLHVESEVPIGINYSGQQIELGYRVDLLVERQIVVELKAVTKLLPVHQAQLLSYLRLGGFQVGLLLNFHVPRMKDGIIRMCN